jgi:hypothetical protein
MPISKVLGMHPSSAFSRLQANSSELSAVAVIVSCEMDVLRYSDAE